MSSNDVTITERDDGALAVRSPGNGGSIIYPVEVAALRARFAAERMPEDVQTLVDEVMRRTPMRITDEGIVMQASEIEAMIADALEAAYSQKAEPEPEPEYKLPGYDEVLEKLDALTIRKGVE